MKSIFIAKLVILANVLSAQLDTSFWRLQEPVPASATEFNLSIAAQPNEDILYIGTSAGLFRAKDKDWNWEPLFVYTPVFHIAVRGETIYFVGTDGRLYYSHDSGSSWDSTQFEGVRQINDLLITDHNEVYVATGWNEVINNISYFRGKGIYKSTDYGKTWEDANSGIGAGRYIAQLEVDQNNRLYATVNEYGQHDGKLMYSENQGEMWSEIPKPYFDWGDGSMEYTNIVNFTAMTVLNTGEIVMAFIGAINSVGTSVCLYNSFDSAMLSAPWQHMKIFEAGWPWWYNGPHNIYQAANGDIYTCRVEDSFIRGSVFYSEDSGKVFTRRALEVANLSSPYFTYTQFAEFSDGRVFAVQEMDNRIYVTKNTLHEPEPSGLKDKPVNYEVTLYPNPNTGVFTLDTELGDSSIIPYELYDLNGVKLLSGNFESGLRAELNIPAGIYIVKLEIDNTMVIKRMLKY